MMYFRALTQGLNDLPEADACLRADLDEQNKCTAWISSTAPCNRSTLKQHAV